MAVQIPFATISKVHQTEVVEDIFFTGLLEQCQSDRNEPEWLKDIRDRAKDNLSRLSVPNRKDEDWRFIDLSDLTQAKFVGANGCSPVLETKDSRLVFVNGIYNPQLSDVSKLPADAYVGSLDNLPSEYEAANYFAQQHGLQDAFSSLNTAGGKDIAVIWVKKNIAIETPIQIVFLAESEAQVSLNQPHILVVAETGSSISLIEEYTGTGEYFTNAVTEVYVRDNARVNHTRLQQESAASYHIGKTAVSQGRDSHYTITGN